MYQKIRLKPWLLQGYCFVYDIYYVTDLYYVAKFYYAYKLYYVYELNYVNDIYYAPNLYYALGDCPSRRASPPLGILTPKL
ncbi:MAG: hypothetical protein IJU77_01960 [Butyrivibrio sp.]|nr:hypothetical protein [Butyrivibrio sp.]